MSNESMPKITKDEAIKLLKEGNNRFVSNKRTFEKLNEARMKEVSENGQFPFAIVLSCSDSRVPPEHIFDVGIGDIFTIRVAGNVATTNEIATIEYGVEHLKAMLIVVLGHTKCGAVTAAAQGVEAHGNIGALLEHIKPAVERVKEKKLPLQGDEMVQESIKENIWLSIENLFKHSDIVKEYVKFYNLMVVGAIYDLSSGKINWLGQHPEETKIAWF